MPRHVLETHAESNVSASWTFFRQWLKNPISTAALSPSSRRLAAQMVAQLPDGARRIIELGGGTGVFTHALLDHGVKPRDLMVLELNSELFTLLQRRFHGVDIVRGDARELESIVHEHRFAEGASVDAILSGLGMLAMSRETQRAILHAAFSVLAQHGRFIQFTYGPATPVAREVLSELGLQARRCSVAWRNVPPASVYVISRNRSVGIRAIRSEANGS